MLLIDLNILFLIICSLSHYHLALPRPGYPGTGCGLALGFPIPFLGMSPVVLVLVCNFVFG